MPGQKPKADEHNRAKETVQMDDRHLTWKEEGMPDSLEWCVIFFFFSHLWKVLGRDPRGKKRVQDAFNWSGCRALPQQLIQENLLSQVQAEPGWSAE